MIEMNELMEMVKINELMNIIVNNEGIMSCIDNHAGFRYAGYSAAYFALDRA